MHTVVIEREADHNRVHTENALEVADDRDRATLADRERFLAPLGGERGTGFGEQRAIEGKLRCRALAELLNFTLASTGKPAPPKAWKAGPIFFGALAPTQPNDTLAL